VPLKSAFVIKPIIYTILGICLYLIYIYQQNLLTTILLSIIFVLVFLILFIHNKDIKKYLILNSLYDKETKLYNRQYFLAELTTTYERAIRYDSPISILIISVTNLFELKKKEQEIVLKELGTYMLTKTRQSDIVCRYDDNKVIVLLPMTDYLHASIAKDRFQNGLSTLEFESISAKPNFKLSITQNQKDEDSEEFLIRSLEGW